MSEYSKEKIKAELHEKYENGEIDDVELEERLFVLEDVPDEKLDGLVLSDDDFKNMRNIHEDRQEQLQKFTEELEDSMEQTNVDDGEEQKLPTTLNGWRSFYGLRKRDEEPLLVVIYNADISVKLEYKKLNKSDVRWDRRYKKNYKKVYFAKTKQSDIVSSFRQLEGKYSKRSLDALKNKLRHLFFNSLGSEIFGTDGDPSYTPTKWCDIVSESQRNLDNIIEVKYGELKEGILELIRTEGSRHYDKVGRDTSTDKKEPKSNPLSILLED